MCAPEGNSEFCFPENLNVSRDEVEGNIKTRGKTKLAISLWSTHRVLFYTECIRKVDPLKQPQFKLAAICCINWTALNASNEKHKVFYTWEIDNNVLKFPSV